ncbi:family 43 glycoside hydrolase [Cryphonectria parasitica EP155]|uniref:Family 43 glycoside hydrolase n=1 Tax=Cryphonectria parasitica (strain ATCC 38755 / EP155) TaxID=660469 RepID=A0A9P4YBC9_CRYP1|nr:family 43 glycoside hydrolase [Cryphonectria parasitica EP155]KAF3769545.1 family 43 glycoside hydrolase [Cryphonectria parasitica EP155]
MSSCWSAVTITAAQARSVGPQLGNTQAPLFQGWYADPEIRVYDGVYWIFPTTSIPSGHQTYFDAFSSSDLVHWTIHPSILTPHEISWATDNLWAPASVSRNGKYYLYFSANGLRTTRETAGIGVAVADAPGGPYRDALGGRLIDSVINNANPMDPDVFVDHDDRVYLYWGGTAVNVALLDDDMYIRDVTPSPTFVEGTKVFRRGSVYYMMWSENGYGDPTYQVAYGMSASPLGPFGRVGVVLQQEPGVAVATGHNGVVNVPGSDIWYIVYHRRAPGETDANKRVVALERMYFDDGDGTIRSVQVTV